MSLSKMAYEKTPSFTDKEFLEQHGEEKQDIFFKLISNNCDLEDTRFLDSIALPSAGWDYRDKNFVKDDLEYGPEDGNVTDPDHSDFYTLLRFRNLNMIHFINFNLKKYKKVFVIAGAGHIPEVYFLENNPIERYSHANMDTRSKKGVATNSTGTLYKYLQTKKYAVILFKDILNIS
jgi:hypothetical protein